MNIAMPSQFHEIVYANYYRFMHHPFLDTNKHFWLINIVPTAFLKLKSEKKVSQNV